MFEHTCTELTERVRRLTETGALSIWGSSTLLKGTWATLWRGRSPQQTKLLPTSLTWFIWYLLQTAQFFPFFFFLRNSPTPASRPNNHHVGLQQTQGRMQQPCPCPTERKKTKQNNFRTRPAYFYCSKKHAKHECMCGNGPL